MRIVILTGAGVSAESGLGTFRDTDGLWSQYDLEEVATPQGFARNPQLVHDFYNARRANAAGAAHNAAHEAIARLQTSGRHDVTLITQNIDNLHERAGSPDVIHMHGELFQAVCAACAHRWPAPLAMQPTDPCPSCAEPATRPDIVWFGEFPYHMDAIEDRLLTADLFAAIGTSGTVYPAAGFSQIAAHAGAKTHELTLDPSGAPFDRIHPGPATQTVPHWVSTLLA